VDHSRNVLDVAAEPYIPSSLNSNPVQDRDCLFAEMLFAARDLARHQFSRRMGSSDLICIECRTVQPSRVDLLAHADVCRTGRVLRMIASLLALPSYQTPTERSASRKASCEPVSAAAEERSRTLPALALCGEPWTANEIGEVRDAAGVLIVDPLGSELPFDAEQPYMQRIVDCVNTCAGFDGATLHQLTGGAQ
jgi:hypothetical protein